MTEFERRVIGRSSDLRRYAMVAAVRCREHLARFLTEESVPCVFEILELPNQCGGVTWVVTTEGLKVETGWTLESAPLNKEFSLFQARNHLLSELVAEVLPDGDTLTVHRAIPHPHDMTYDEEEKPQ